MTHARAAGRRPSTLPATARDRLRRALHFARTLPFAFLGAALVVVAPEKSLAPGFDLDPSWSLVLNIAHREGLHFGSDLEFTFGPWGFLDTSDAVSRGNVVLAFAYRATAVLVWWLALWFAGRAWPSHRTSGTDAVAAAAATLVVIVAHPLTGPSSELLVGCVLGVVLYLTREGRHRHAWVPAAVAAAGALTLQVKFSEGVAFVFVIVAAAVFAPFHRVRRIAEAAVVYLAVTAGAWLLAGQRPGDFGSWLRWSVEISRGYPDAMSVEREPNTLGYSTLAIFGLVIVIAIARYVRRETARRGAGIALTLLAVAYLGFRATTVRHGNETFFFLLLIPAFAVVVNRYGALWQRAAALGLVVALSWSGGLPINPRDVQVRLANTVEVGLSSGYQTTLLRTAREFNMRAYQLPANVLAAVGDRPVNVDGYYAALPWTYRLNWHPMPVFQSYVAYTAKLDALNARWLRTAPASQAVLRSSMPAIDQRNPLWDSAAYVTDELCRTKVELSSPGWLLLGKSASRCGSSSVVETVEVRAGQRIAVPSAGPDQLVTMSFRPDRTLLQTMIATVFKPTSPLFVDADGRSYRLPPGLAGGPLVMNVPDSARWPVGFGGGTRYRTLRLTYSGVVQFRVRSYRPAE